MPLMLSEDEVVLIGIDRLYEYPEFQNINYTHWSDGDSVLSTR